MRPAQGARHSLSASFSPQVLRRWLTYGAITAVIVVVVMFSYLRRTHSPPVSLSRTYKTGVAQRATVTLADGSNILLAPATTLDVKDHNVTLVGEAIFTVSPERDRVFAVRAGSSVTRVLGTTFGVRAYPSDTSIRVTVATGRVSVASAVLSAGDVVFVARSTAAHTLLRETGVSSAFSWTSGRLVFEDTPITAVLRDLERWYNIRFALGDATVAARVVTVSLRTDSLDETVSILTPILNARAERTSSGVTFYTR